MNSKHLSIGTVAPPCIAGKLRFYSMRFCPFAHRIQLVLNAKKIPYDVVFINLSAKPEWFLDLNPMGKVPCIVLDNGEVLYESLVVAEYLNEAYPENQLYPTDPAQKAIDKIIIERFSSITSMMFKLFVNQSENRELFNEMLKALEYLEVELINRGTRFFGGDKPGMVDLMIWPWFERIEVVKINKGKEYVIPPQQFTKLLEWIAQMKNDFAVKDYYLEPEKHAKFLQSFSTASPQYDILLK